MKIEVIDVWLPRPFDGPLTYRTREDIPSSQISAGTAIEVSLGRQGRIIGFAAGPSRAWSAEKDLPTENLKPITQVLPEAASVPADLWSFCQWSARYYDAPLGEILQMLPDWKPTKERSKSQRSKKSAEKFARELNEDQKNAVEKIYASGSTRPILLWGVTGSGKTEVYIEAARRTLAQGKSVLILVPEIVLTPMLEARFQQAFAEVGVALWHSALSAGAKHQLLLGLADGSVRVLVGARSALFTPMRDLGLIVVDEEHETTYKQEDRVRYHARDLALVRARGVGARVILGSATPSLESWQRAQEGRYELIELGQRYSNRPMPMVKVVDLLETPVNEELQSFFAEETITKIKEVLLKGEQVLLYLNRRGFSSSIQCHDCGWIEKCSECSVTLTVYRGKKILKCHYCDFKKPIEDQCPKCFGDHLDLVGAGTESIETELPKLIPEIKIQRLDRDQVTSQARLKKVLDTFREGECNTLVGTQMLTKGHDFERVTLVVVVLADQLFAWPDFRASERAAQALIQVAGRAGRGDLPGEVWIQTFQPDHEVLRVLSGERSWREFCEIELAMRSELHNPPFWRMALLRVEHGDERQVMYQAAELRQVLDGSCEGIEILGPSEPLVARVQGIYRMNLIVRAEKVEGIQKAVKTARLFFKHKKWKLVVDIDPLTVG